MTTAYRILEVDPQCDDALTLLRDAAAEASALYPEFQVPNAPRPTNHPNPPRGIYLMAYLNGEPIGMAAHRPFDDHTTEVRRMFVKRIARRVGVARALLHSIEAHAKSAGFTCLVLETGNRQSAAMTLYEQFGFARTDPFGVYKDDPTSVCFKKVIHG